MTNLNYIIFTNQHKSDHGNVSFRTLIALQLQLLSKIGPVLQDIT